MFCSCRISTDKCLARSLCSSTDTCKFLISKPLRVILSSNIVYFIVYFVTFSLPLCCSVFYTGGWHCWLIISKIMWPVKVERWAAGWGRVQMIWKCSNRCHSIISSLASLKYKMVYIYNVSFHRFSWKWGHWMGVSVILLQLTYVHVSFVR